MIDEASQSDVWAIPAISRAKQLLIVGDDKQVSPSDVGKKELGLNALRRKFLQDLPYGQHFLPGASIYELGSTMFSKDVVRLREHFRSVEPIIAFSNRHFYDGEIKPLRIPSASERIDPPLVDMFVKGGYRRGSAKVNKPEANAIVDEIRRLSEEPTFANRSIGVVSLLGHEQAKEIQDRVLEQLGEEVFLCHRLRCGDAMHFQGKEADIVMISMVAAGKISAATGRTYEQRYNVACSRARDRLYVFHSFQRDELKDGDLRAKLLDHLANPLAGEDRLVGNDARMLCESDFEREVFDELIQRNYQVEPQVRAGGFRIDLVVEGEDSRRLAIECDGDRYHGIDRWMDDMSRQRVLERLGWKFWRCWASSWVRDRDASLADLLETLRERGEPVDGDAPQGVSGLVEYRVVEARDDLRTEDAQVSDNAIAVEAREAGEDDEVGKDEDEASGVQAPIGAHAPAVPSAASDRATQQTSINEERVVGLNDIVEYAYVDSLEDALRVTVVSGPSQPDLGFVNQQTALGCALLGAAVGDEVEAHLPRGVSQLQILSVTPQTVH